MKKEKKLLCDNIIVDSIKDFTLDQLKLFYFVIYKFRLSNKFENSLEENSIRIDYYEIRNMFKHKKCSTNELINIIKSMPIDIICIDKETSDVRRIAILEEISFLRNSEEFYFKFNDNNIYLIEEIDKNFSTIKIDELNSLKSKHTARFYELFRRYENMGIIKMKLEDIRVYFNLSETYSNCNLERVVIKESIEELKDKIGANISYKKEKRSGKITHYVFKFK